MTALTKEEISIIKKHFSTVIDDKGEDRTLLDSILSLDLEHEKIEMMKSALREFNNEGLGKKDPDYLNTERLIPLLEDIFLVLTNDFDSRAIIRQVEDMINELRNPSFSSQSNKLYYPQPVSEGGAGYIRKEYLPLKNAPYSVAGTNHPKRPITSFERSTYKLNFRIDTNGNLRIIADSVTGNIELKSLFAEKGIILQPATGAQNIITVDNTFTKAALDVLHELPSQHQFAISTGLYLDLLSIIPKHDKSRVN
jgi:hypothetical protein